MGVPPGQRVLAALGPKVLRLAADRTAGAHPYLVTPEHTRAHETYSADGAHRTEQHAILDTDVVRARERARTALTFYLKRQNYTNNGAALVLPTRTSPSPIPTASSTDSSRSEAPNRWPPESPNTLTRREPRLHPAHFR